MARTKLPQTAERRTRSDGRKSRQAILHEAGQLATVEGISGLSIGGLADAVGMSKSGIFAHFGSKEELQLATIDAASTVFTEKILAPAESPASGLDRLRALSNHFLSYLGDGVYPGGCFFAAVATETAARPGPVRDAALVTLNEFYGRLEQAARDARDEGEIDSSEDPEQLAFEVDSLLLLANLQFVISGDPASIARAHKALDRRLAAAAPSQS
jgi:AcrR family transcriptional regulator